MPIIRANSLNVELSDSGTGPTVVLIHSSVSGNRQWRSLTAVLAPNFRVLAVNLRGYGETTRFAGTRTQTLDDQVAVVSAACNLAKGPIRLVDLRRGEPTLVLRTPGRGRAHGIRGTPGSRQSSHRAVPALT